jgi:hypothetical protein
MASYQMIYNDLSHLTSTLGRNETVFAKLTEPVVNTGFNQSILVNAGRLE